MDDEDPDLGPEIPEAPQPDNPADGLEPDITDPTESLPSVEESFEMAEDRIRLFVAAVITANIGTLLLGISGLMFFSGG